MIIYHQSSLSFLSFGSHLEFHSFETMDFEYKILCCHVAVDVAVLCTLEIIVIVATYLTGFKHPLMTCQSFNVSILERYNEPTVLSQHKICTTNGPLVFWIIIHLFTDLMALMSVTRSFISIMKTRLSVSD
ncbi:hypothetical protein CRE_27099 [Caenorhabditis remanei]|uniref:Uncharacterized protein n=1 Tax=Caenorhabditis remanei TaxID=31234 RepID=E3LNF1_CAERE|nr:hypothetical protein CRE_27099 [Caenorhabditis remanei]